jgi:hypothetical protein
MPPIRRSTPVDVHTPQTAALIRLKVARLRRMLGPIDMELIDAGQTLWLKLVEARPRFDPNRASLVTFADRVLDRRMIDLVRRTRAGRRARGRECRLNGELDEGLKLKGPRSLARVDLRLDVQTAIDSLPRHLQPLARLLMHQNVTTVMRCTGLSREAVRGRCRLIAAHFEQLGVVPDEACRGS